MSTEIINRGRNAMFIACGTTEEESLNAPIEMDDGAHALLIAVLLLAINHPDPDAFVVDFENNLKNAVSSGALAGFRAENEAEKARLLAKRAKS